MEYKVTFINRVAFLVILIWTMVIGATVFLLYFENYSYADSLAENEARVSVKKDLAYRTWVASHGGVYVPITQRTPPNKYLSHLKHRDVNTTANQQLTLMNPAYTLSQMMRDYSELYGVKGHITSKVLMNPKNMPDSWEKSALEMAEITKKDVSAMMEINGEKHFRYLSPLITKKSCLKCHASQGYKIGDIRGGVSVAVPLKTYYDKAYSQTMTSFLVLMFIFILGVLVILYGRRKAREILENKIKDYEQHIFSLVSIIEKRDSYTAGHTQRVARYATLIAEKMGYSKETIDDLYRACMLHDIGKISTPDSILLKPGKLTYLEYEIIKEHVVVSYELLSKVDIYKDIAEIVRHHHEQYDGSGYPQGLKSGEIPMMSYIMTVADAFDAMTTNRVYKARKSVSTAIEELKLLASKQFHPEVVQAAIIALKDIELEMSITQRPKTKIEKERFAYFYRDQLTGVYNKDYLDFVLAYNRSDEFNIRCINAIYLQNFNRYNKNNSWKKGDKLLQTFAKKLEAISSDGYVFRMYGDDFVILHKEHFDLDSFEGELKEALKDTGVMYTYKHIDMSEQTVHSLADLENLL